MTFDIKLKVGFFKTQPYYLAIRPGQIIMTPQEDQEDGSLVIEDKELQSVSITRRKLHSMELEIVSHSITLIGSFASQTDMEEAAKNLAREFKHKFIFGSESFEHDR
ncbi:hypothetical protein ASZ90_019918 [hydrocarbon metagenome]|uniref:Uncharacterized protein n=1 Tax=hydrocarbon metagenome TaxID=938273 RepID=A0A0W8E265_9ZZZZ